MKTLITAILFILVKVSLDATPVINSVSGFASPSVITAFAENDKFIYIGTNDGLIIITKKNGKKQILTNKKSSLPSNHITSIACTLSGHAYIGTDKGMLFWDNYGFIPITTENSQLPDNHISALAVDHNDVLWIGTASEGLVKAIGYPVKAFKTQPIEFNNESIYSISVDPSGCLWVSFLQGGYGCLYNGEWHIYPSDQSIENMKRGTIRPFLLNTPEACVYVVDGTSAKKLPVDIPCQKKTCVYFDSKYARMFLCYEDGVLVLNPQNPFMIPGLMSYCAFLETLNL